MSQSILLKNEKKISFFNKIKLLLRSVREYKKASILSIVFILIETCAECLIPFFMQKVLDAMQSNLIYTDEILNTVLIYAGILLSLAVVSFTGGVLSGYFSAKGACGFIRNLRRDTFEKITTFSFNNIDKFSSSSLITRQTTDIWNIQMSYMLMIRIVVRAPFMFIFAFVMAIITAPSLSWVFAISIPLIILFCFPIVIIANKKFQYLFDRYDEMNEIVNENVRGMRVVKTYAREDYEKKKFAKRSGDLAKGFTFVERLISLTNPLIQVVFYISMTLFLFVGSYILIQNNTNQVVGGLTVGSLSSLITYSAQVLSSLTMVAFSLFMILMSVPCINRVYEVLSEIPSIQNNEIALKEVENGDIEFKNVSFKYKEKSKKYALSDINLKIKNGETIGIIGGTGSSKSTLVNLISRFYDTTEGEVLLANKNVKDYDIKTLRNNVSMVLQKNILFGGTIASNLQWGNENASEEEMIEATKIAQAYPFIVSLKDGFNSVVEQGGVNFSGGQKQRLCIARALLKHPKVLILDDSTSAVDTKTDALIREGLKKSMPGTTKIIIAQRISSVIDADRIIVMDSGKIDGIGTHDELLKTSKIYQEVYEIQNRIGGNQNEVL